MQVGLINNHEPVGDEAYQLVGSSGCSTAYNTFCTVISQCISCTKGKRKEIVRDISSVLSSRLESLSPKVDDLGEG